jgi:O-antigen/teichoic acid export membrane protein
MLNRALAIATGVIIARSLGPEGKGIYAVAFMLPGLVLTFGGLGLNHSLIYQIGRKHLTLEQALGTIIVLDIVLSVVLMALTLTLAPLLSGTLVRGVPFNLILLTTLSIPSALMLGHLRDILRALGRFQIYSIFVFLENVVKLMAFLILIAFSSLTLSRVIVVQLALGLILAIVCLGAVARHLSGKLRPHLKAVRTLLSFGLRTHVSSIFANLERRFDILLLNAFLFPAQVGLYTVAVGAAQLVLYTTDSMGTVLFPRVSSSSREQVHQFLPRISRMSILLSALVGVGLVIVGKPLISLLYGPDFEASYTAMVILVPGIVMLTLSRVGEIYLKGVGRPGVVSAVTVVSFAVNLGANLILIPLLGIRGAALASSISYSLGACLVLIIFLQDSKLSVRDIVVPTWDDLIKLLEIKTSIEKNNVRAWIGVKVDQLRIR